MLDDNSFMTVMSEFDPEKDVFVKNFEMILRLLPYKDIIVKYLVNFSAILGKGEIVKRFVDLVE